MDSNNFILFFFLIGINLFFYKYLLLILNKHNPKLLIDDQFKKPQAFHEFPISIAGGICAGFASVITLPIDTVIANSQNVKSKGNIFDVIKGIYNYNGIGGFYRGVAMRIVHASYHTIFVVSFGRLLYNKYYPSESG